MRLRIGFLAIAALLGLFLLGWASAARAQGWCVGVVTGVAADPALCNGLKKDDIVCVPCPANGQCASGYNCTRRRTVLSGVCQLAINVTSGATCVACPAGHARHGKLKPPKAWWRWGWSCAAG